MPAVKPEIVLGSVHVNDKGNSNTTTLPDMMRHLLRLFKVREDVVIGRPVEDTLVVKEILRTMSCFLMLKSPPGRTLVGMQYLQYLDIFSHLPGKK